MGRTKDLHLRQQRDRGQGWDRKLFAGNPNDLTAAELQQELAKRGLATEGNWRSLRNRFIRALCVGVPVGQPKPNKPPFPDTSGRTLYFELPDTDAAAACLEIDKKGRLLQYHDADTPMWTTLTAVFPVPADTRISWSFYAEKMYNLVVGVAREDMTEDRMLGADDRGWGYFVTLGSKHFNDHSGEGEPYGQVGKAGCRVTVIMDTARGTLEFKLDGKSLGEAFHDIYGTVYPALSLCGPSMIHVGNEKVLPPVTMPTATASITALHLMNCSPVAPGNSQAGVQLQINVKVEGGSLALTPLAFGVTFSPKTVTIAAGEDTSDPFEVAVVEGAKTGPIPITVLIKRDPSVANGGPTSLICDGLTVGLDSSEEGEPPAKQQKIS